MHSRERIYKATQELLKTNKINNISVQQIIDLADISRRTFYRNFNDKYDVINSLYVDFMRNQLEASVFPQDIKKYIHAVHLFFRDNRQIIQRAFIKDNADSLTKAAIESINSFYRKVLMSYSGSGLFDNEGMNFLVSFYSEGCLGVMEKWYVKNGQLPLDQLEYLIYISLPPSDIFVKAGETGRETENMR